MEKKSKRGRKAKRNAPPPLSKGGFTPESIVDKIDLSESCNQVRVFTILFHHLLLLHCQKREIHSVFYENVCSFI